MPVVCLPRSQLCLLGGDGKLGVSSCGPPRSCAPNINTLLKLLCTLPVTSCSAERFFSELKRIKTPFRSAMTNARLSGLTLLYAHCDIAVDTSAAIDEFTRRHQCWMQMAEILEDQDHDD